MMGFEDLREEAHEIEDPLKTADPGSIDVPSLLKSLDAFTTHLRAKCLVDSGETEADPDESLEDDGSSSTFLHDGVRIPFSALDNLVDLVLKRLTGGFARERKDLVRTGDRGSEPTDTEDLRVAIKGYRALVDRLLTTEL